MKYIYCHAFASCYIFIILEMKESDFYYFSANQYCLSPGTTATVNHFFVYFLLINKLQIIIITERKVCMDKTMVKKLQRYMKPI